MDCPNCGYDNSKADMFSKPTKISNCVKCLAKLPNPIVVGPALEDSNQVPVERKQIVE